MVHHVWVATIAGLQLPAELVAAAGHAAVSTHAAARMLDEVGRGARGDAQGGKGKKEEDQRRGRWLLLFGFHFSLGSGCSPPCTACYGSL
jgi:hypothetical protein